LNNFFCHDAKMFPFSQICWGFVFGCLLSLFEFNTPVFFTIIPSILILSLYYKRFVLLSLSIVAACIYLITYYHLFYSWELPNYHKGKSYKINVQVIKVYDSISSKDSITEQPLYFKAKLLKLNGEVINQKVDINLSWYKTKNSLSTSDIITANAKLKPFRGLHNFGNNNKELWAFYNHIKAKGYIDNKFNLQIIKNNSLNTLQTLKNAVSKVFINSDNYWLFKAILFGDKSGTPATYKEQFKILGISHLFAISGLHIGMVFAIGFFGAKLLFSMLMLKTNQRVNLNKLYTCVGLILALLYTLLSGCSVSAVRALVMLAVFSTMYLKGYQYLSFNALQIALISSLLFNPFQLLNPGIYFSFIAVYILIMTYKKLNLAHSTLLNRSLWLFIIQINLTVGLFPLVWFLSDGSSFIGIIANIFAIPVMAIVILPSIFIIVLFSLAQLSELLLGYLDSTLSVTLSYVAAQDLTGFWFDLPELNWQSLLLIYLLLLLLIHGLKCLIYIPICIFISNRLLIDKPLWHVDILDVGHGLSVLITQNKKTYVYDLGAKYINGLSIVRSQIIPYIKAQNLTVKHTKISPKDNDPAGGLHDWIDFGFKDTLLVDTNDTSEIDNCTIGKMRFGLLTIKNLYPINKSKRSNNNSCVVKISDGTFSILLPGDIHKNAEKELINTFENIEATILISPHHGSKTSSSIAFIKSVSPALVIHSSAFYGRWLMPHIDVVQRYADLGVQQLTTGVSGQIRIMFYSDKYVIDSARSKQSYWFLVN